MLKNGKKIPGRTLPFIKITFWDYVMQGRLSPQDLWRKFPPNLIGHRSLMELDLGPSIKYVTLFLANFDPLPLSHYVAHPGIPPNNTSHISDPPIFSRLSTKIPDKSPLYKFSLNCSRGLLSGGLCPGDFCL